MKKGVEYLKNLSPEAMYKFLEKCTGDFEYCPIPGMLNVAQYYDECPKQIANRKMAGLHTKEAMIGVDSNLCKKCVKEWLGINE